MTDMITLGPLSLLASLNIIFFVLGIKLTTANISQILYGAVPIVVGVLVHFISKEKLSLRKVLGIVIGFIGVLLVLLLPIWQKGKFSGDFLGNILIALAVLSWSLYMFLSKKAQTTHTPFHIVSIFILVTTILLLPFFLVESAFNFGWWNGLSLSSILTIVYVAVIGTITTYFLNQYSIRHGGAVFASLAFYLSPIFGFIIAFWLLGEQFTFGLGIGAVLALLGVYITTQK
jgi:drug/metabolite transporter (DMT)-like permease